MAGLAAPREACRGRRERPTASSPTGGCDLSETEPSLVEVHEIKVTKQRLASELRNPEKSTAWMQVADRFWLSVPFPDLVEGYTIPPECGILLLPYGKPGQILREAPLRHPTLRLRPSLLHPPPRVMALQARTRLTVASRLRAE
jgi:hypothetical protein